jgi:hypothetical protein
MSHKAQAIVLTCIDFRFRKAVQKFLEEDLNLTDFDLKGDAGGAKELLTDGPVKDWIMRNFQIAFDLHEVNRVILINHTDCGAYGGSKLHGSVEEEKKFHEEQLKQAVAVVRAVYPNKEFEAYLAILGEPIVLQKIV